jgi:hypothetical protein
MKNSILTSKYDVVVVLANEMSSDGVLNCESKSRAKKTIDIVNNEHVNYVVTCGWAYRSDSNIKICDAFKLYLMQNATIASKKIITEANSRDTVGDAFFTKKNLALKYFWKNICVVTSDYHVGRASEIFKFIYGERFNIDVVGAESKWGKSRIDDEISSVQIFRSTFSGVNQGDDRKIDEVIKNYHPYYNGLIYPKINL